MIWKAMDKLRKRPDRTEVPAPSNGSGGSIQERLNQMRQGGGRPSREAEPAQPRVVPSANPPSSPGRSHVDEEEAFVDDFARDLKRKMARKTETPADILRERMREVREGLTPPNGVEKTRPASPPPVTPAPQPVEEPVVNNTADMPTEGAILAISSDDLAIFHKSVPGKGYQLVYMVNGDGTVIPQGIYLDGYEFRVIGQLSPVALADIQKNLVWDRDILVFHLKSVQDARLIPQPSESRRAVVEAQPPARPTPERQPAATAPNAPEEPEDPGLFRGRRFRISMGKGREWDAIYWGTDEQGTVVAHRTNGQWNLMHLDISRFQNSLKLNGHLDERELREVETSLLQAHG